MRSDFVFMDLTSDGGSCDVSRQRRAGCCLKCRMQFCIGSRLRFRPPCIKAEPGGCFRNLSKGHSMTFCNVKEILASTGFPARCVTTDPCQTGILSPMVLTLQNLSTANFKNFFGLRCSS